ncbi:hypothetical protein GBAR_LOCUS11275, partial [Geodia barretti]
MLGGYYPIRSDIRGSGLSSSGRPNCRQTTWA